MPYQKLKKEVYSLLGGINSKVSIYNNAQTEFRDLSNLNFRIPNALTKSPGNTLYCGATISGRVTGLYEYTKVGGESYLIATANTNAYTVSTANFSAFKTNLLSNALFSFVTIADRLFASNGQDFFKFDGANSYSYSLPNGITGSFTGSGAAGGSLAPGTTQTFVIAYGYINQRGYYGPISNGITVTISGAAGQNSITYSGITAPPSIFGATAIMLYRSAAGGIDLFGTTLAPLGTTTVTDTGFTLGLIPANDNLYFTLAPRYLEIYNNSLAMAGFSSLQSSLYLSNLAAGDPISNNDVEAVDPVASRFDFRTNDGDRVTGIKTFSGSLLVGKRKSLHRLTGDSINNYSIQEITDQYGFLSHWAVVVCEDVLWFLDEKGIVEYNGANVRIVSNKVEPIFQNMNIVAASENATAVHDKLHNELWFAIPCNGATMNNTIVCYDYVAQAWTKYEGQDVSRLLIARGVYDQNTVFMGGYTGAVLSYGASLPSYYDRGITCSATTGFHNNGNTIEQMWRRFYLNVDTIIGASQAIDCVFKTNYGSTVGATGSIYQNQFQTRLEFGTSAKSINAQWFHYSASLPITIYGYALESRVQRWV